MLWFLSFVTQHLWQSFTSRRHFPHVGGHHAWGSTAVQVYTHNFLVWMYPCLTQSTKFFFALRSECMDYLPKMRGTWPHPKGNCDFFIFIFHFARLCSETVMIPTYSLTMTAQLSNPCYMCYNHRKPNQWRTPLSEASESESIGTTLQPLTKTQTCRFRQFLTNDIFL